MWRILLEFMGAVLVAVLFVVLVLPFGTSAPSSAPTAGRPDVGKSPDTAASVDQISSNLNRQK
jgi:hypothetical protein